MEMESFWKNKKSSKNYLGQNVIYPLFNAERIATKEKKVVRFFPSQLLLLAIIIIIFIATR